MEFISGLSSLGFFGIIIAGIIGFIKPSLFEKQLKGFATRKRILVGSLVGAFGLATIAGATAPPQPSEQQQNTPVITQQVETKSEPVVEVKTLTETEVIKFKTQEKDDSTLASGSTKVVQQGKNGEKTLTYEVTYINGKETDRKLESEEVTKKPVTKIIANGTYVAPTPDPQPTSTYYENCTAAREAGAAPIYRGEPGYGSHLDRDDDGVGCE